MPPLTSKIDVKTCKKFERVHPCDPAPPCNPLEDPEGDCTPPFLCLERLKNPEDPNHKTRCQSGQSIGVRSCVKIPDPHPCDPPPPCNSLQNRKQVCDDPPICKERIKNPDLKKVRRIMCTNSKGQVVEAEVVKQ